MAAVADVAGAVAVKLKELLEEYGSDRDPGEVRLQQAQST